MDITKLASSNTTELNLLHPVTEQKTGVIISGHTPDSTAWRKLEKDISGPNKKQSLILEKGKQKIELDGDGMEKRNELLTRSITSIVGITNNDKAVELNDGIAIKSFLDNPNVAWILEQWGEHVDDRSNFFGGAKIPASSGVNASDS